MKLRVYGSRGIIPTPGSKTVKYGGNTPCFGLRMDGVNDFFIFDAGTGIRRLGEEFSSRKGRYTIRLFLSHFHHDHLDGLSLFIPLFLKGNQIHFYGPKDENTPLERVVRNRLFPPFLQAGLGETKADLHFHEIPYQSQESLQIGDVQILARPLNHPAPNLGYRIEYGERSMAYMTDHEPAHKKTEEEKPQERRHRWHRDEKEGDTPSANQKERGGEGQRVVCTNEQYRQFVKGCNLLIGDGQYLPNELKLYHGWGHGSMNFIVNQAVAADVEKLIFTHHDPNRSDGQIDDIVAHYRKLLKRKRSPLELVAAREVEEHTI